jgi:cell wall-associated NlpC family hydrolase
MSKIFKTAVIVYGVGVVLLLGLIFVFIIMFNNKDQSKGKNNASNNTTSVDVNKLTRPGISRKEVIDVALSLVGKVEYYWGGTSPPGWNSEWGKPRIVIAPGDWTNGTVQPYGLDCSGFIDWTFKTAGNYNGLYPPTSYQINNTYPISESELKPGDIVFANLGMTSYNHVGIFYRRLPTGQKQYIHSEGGTGVTINSTPVFKHWRRPYIKFEDD